MQLSAVKRRSQNPRKAFSPLGGNQVQRQKKGHANIFDIWKSNYNFWPCNISVVKRLDVVLIEYFWIRGILSRFLENLFKLQKEAFASFSAPFTTWPKGCTQSFVSVLICYVVPLYMWQWILIVYQLRVVFVWLWSQGTSRFKTSFSRRDSSNVLFAQRSRLLKFFESSYDCSIWWKQVLHREYKFKDCLYSVFFENVIDMRRFIIGLNQTWITETGTYSIVNVTVLAKCIQTF